MKHIVFQYLIYYINKKTLVVTRTHGILASPHTNFML